MSKKDNFNQAFYEMFGVGKEETGAAASTANAASAGESVTEKKNRNASAVSAQRAAKTYLASGTVVEGTITAKGDIEIAGELKGNLVTDGTATVRSDIKGNVTAAGLFVMDCVLEGDVVVSGQVQISEKSRVVGNIRAGEISCAGTVVGDLDVTGNVTLEEKSRIEGNIVTKTMTMVCGAKICGNLQMKND